MLLASLTALILGCSEEFEVKENEEYTEIEIKTFTGVIKNKKLLNGRLTVEVCEEYRSILGDEVYVHVKSCKKGKAIEVVASNVRVTYSERFDDEPVSAKPIIYFYPESDTVCSTKVALKNGEFICTYPDHGENGWQNFVAHPDSTLTFPDGKEYYALYWEGVSSFKSDFSKGFCVKGSDSAKFFDEILPKTGLSTREANEFIIYWLPILQENKYNLISFRQEAYTDSAKLIIDPAPDSLLRVYMAAQTLDKPIEIEAQEFEAFERKGFTVVE